MGILDITCRVYDPCACYSIDTNHPRRNFGRSWLTRLPSMWIFKLPVTRLARSCALRFRSRNCDFADYMDNKFCLKRSQVAPARMRCVSDCLRQFGVRHWRAVEFTLEHYVSCSRSTQEVFQLLLVTVRMQCEFHPGAPVGTGSILQYSHF